MAVGLENGRIVLVQWLEGSKDDEWRILQELDSDLAHHRTVKRLRFKRRVGEEEKLLLASCSSDHSVKVFEVK